MNEENKAKSTLQLGDFKTHWLGYVAASIFLYIEGNRLDSVPIMVIGILLGVAALFILLGIIPHKGLRRATNYVDESLKFSLYIVAITGFIKAIFELIDVTGTAVWIWVLLFALLGFIIFDIVIIIKNMRDKAKLIGWKATLIGQFKALSFVLTLFVLVLLVTNVQDFGEPYLWLVPVAVAQLTTFILEGSFFKKEPINN